MLTNVRDIFSKDPFLLLQEKRGSATVPNGGTPSDLTDREKIFPAGGVRTRKRDAAEEAPVLFLHTMLP